MTLKPVPYDVTFLFRKPLIPITSLSVAGSKTIFLGIFTLY